MLKAYLYRLRQIEPQARRLRTFALFLRRNPDYQPPAADELAVLPDWACRHGGLQRRPHPDLSDGITREALIEVAATIAPAKVRIQRERGAGRLATDATEAPVVQLQPRPVQVALQQYLTMAQRSHQPLSALAWKRTQRAFADLEEEGWLLYVLHAVQMQGGGRRSRLQGLEVQLREVPPPHPLAGNRIIEDILLWKKL